MYNELLRKEHKLAVIGLGYVGLPIALEFARKIDVIGFDINAKRVEMMKNGIDPSCELEKEAFEGCQISFTDSLDELKEARFFVVAVPTPVDEHNVPDLTPVLKASETIGKVIKKGDYVVFESTVYPGCTEEDCLPVGPGPDFHWGLGVESSVLCSWHQNRSALESSPWGELPSTQHPIERTPTTAVRCRR
jgi:UDP-N-acetyl-D-galactosamine dehydrogenase